MCTYLHAWQVNAVPGVRYIGLLDVYGFEFFEVNTVEPLCIDY